MISFLSFTVPNSPRRFYDSSHIIASLDMAGDHADTFVLALCRLLVHRLRHCCDTQKPISCQTPRTCTFNPACPSYLCAFHILAAAIVKTIGLLCFSSDCLQAAERVSSMYVSRSRSVCFRQSLSIHADARGTRAMKLGTIAP